MSRFGTFSLKNIEESINNNKPVNTVRSEHYIWNQFTEFCDSRKYTLGEDQTDEELANILQDWAYNMRKKDGTEYKETVVKLMWNVTAKLLQTQYLNDYKRSIDPFKGDNFEKARHAKHTKRKELQRLPEKRKVSASALTVEEIKTIALNYDENTPDGLQKKFYQIAAPELAWRGNEATYCLLDYFQEEYNNDGSYTGRIEYNTVFSKTAQGGDKSLAKSKWLIPNQENEDLCPVRLFRKMLSKRTENITTRRLFLSPNKNWAHSKWYKNIPIGINEISKWTRLGAEKIGLDTKKKRITNHSNRTSTVSNLSRAGANLQEIIKITGHTSTNSVEPYLTLNEEHHAKIITSLRKNNATTSNSSSVSSTAVSETNSGIVYNNCTFNFYNK